MLANRRAAFDPVARIDVFHAVDVLHGRMMDVTAYYALRSDTQRLGCEERFEIADRVHGAFYAIFQIGG